MSKYAQWIYETEHSSFKKALDAFSDRLHVYARTIEGERRAQELRDLEYDHCKQMYQIDQRILAEMDE